MQMIKIQIPNYLELGRGEVDLAKKNTLVATI